jgi:nitroimidazol reductase NimA-like FMN-containing flavoprotein (pyridoxamine 5'-phosphate oxidase superfamily)
MAINDAACEWGFRYKSVMGTGRAYIVDDYDEKCRALDVIMAHYSEKNFTYREERVADIYIVRIDIESLSGKRAI